MLTAHVRKTFLQGMPHATYMGYVRCRIRQHTIWTESVGVHSLTKADAQALAEKLLDALTHAATTPKRTHTMALDEDEETSA